MKNQSANVKAHSKFKKSSSVNPIKSSAKIRDKSKKPNQNDASDLPAGWAFAT